eukprot:TRINITY_DN4098_c0_g1_i1.p1 TRINITY_DN4098_c0_g1~~TRINITY_DN4098_c0_g1_i1.p1  ORF type:complete len:277 (-),score=57.38 TRINITY_DN4098_c0_g1_i1:127-900(-)
MTSLDPLCESVLQVAMAYVPLADRLPLQRVCRYWYALLSYEAESAQVLLYDHDFDCNGLFHFIGTKFGHMTWDIGRVGRFVHVSTSDGETSSINAKMTRWNNDCIALLHRQSHRCFLSNANHSSFFEVDLGPRFRIAPTHYTLRHGSQQQRAPRHWDLLAATAPGGPWTVLSEHRDDASLGPAADSCATFSLAVGDTGFRCFRIAWRGPSAMNCHYFHVNGFELYGRFAIHACGAGEAELAAAVCTPPTANLSAHLV